MTKIFLTWRGGMLCICVTFVVLACRSTDTRPDDQQQTASKDARARSAASADGANPARAAASVERTQLTEAAHALVAVWQKAQNEGDFAAYEKLYAERFTGVRRVGARTERFDRAGWIGDRKKMFARPFIVSISDMKAAPTGNIVEFTQTFSTKSFSDSGRKRLVLEQHDGLRIASEEMLFSSLRGSDEKGDLPSAERFSFVTQSAGGPALILGTEVDPNSVLSGVKYIDDGRAEREVETKALAPRWRDLVGKEFVLYGREGRVCSAQVRGFGVSILLHPHFGVVNTWNGRENWSEKGQETPPAARALELWKMSEMGGRFFVAKLQSTGPCEGAMWATDAQLPAPALWTDRSPTAEEEALVLKHTRALPIYRQMQARFKQAFHQDRPWDETGDGDDTLRAFEDGVGNVYISALLRSGADDSCASGFDEDLWVLFRKHGGKVQLASAPPDDHVSSAYPRFLEPLRPQMAFDLNADGIPEMVGDFDFFQNGARGLRSAMNVSPAYFDCPC